MSAVVRLAPTQDAAPARIALLGTGVVGSAFVARYARLRERGLRLPELAIACNTRELLLPSSSGRRWRESDEGAAESCTSETSLLRRTFTPTPLPTGEGFLAVDSALLPGDIVVDATASEAVAEKHALWLTRGVHVVTANKLGSGGTWLRAQAISHARTHSGARYGDSATVGAGLPLLRSIRELVRGGDRIHRVEGVLSGSLAWLFNHYDGMRPFSGFVREARNAGYTEPDPRLDLSGEDVRRKLLILARAAGLPLQAQDVSVESLVPADLAALPMDELDAALPTLDVALAARLQEACRNGERLRFLGRFDADGASVGLQALPGDHPLCAGIGTDNKVAISSDRYKLQPLVIQGPGAGAEVTAAALWDDVLRII